MEKLSENKILVTGSDGFIGSMLLKQLQQTGAEVKGIDLKSGFDITDWGQFKDLENVNLVYHLAALMGIPFSFKHPRKVYEVNVIGTLNVLEFCRFNDIKKLIFASSYVYGQPQYLPIDERHPVNPTNPYARSKVMGEELCRGYAEDYGIECLIIRPFNIYGPSQNENFLIPSILKQICENNKIELNDPEPRRDLLFVSDMVDAYIKAGEFKNSKFEIFNIGFGKSYSVNEIVEIVLQLIDKKIEVKYTGERRQNEIMDTVANISKASKKLNWHPKIELQKGLASIFNK